MSDCAKRLVLSAGLAALLALPPAALASGGPGTTAITALKFDMGPRAAALGGAYTAIAEGNYAVWYNPAGLGMMRNMEAAGSFKSNVQDTKNQFFGFLLPIPATGLANNEKPVLALSLYMSKNGDMEWNKLNSDGTPAFTGRSVSAGGDSVYVLSYGENVYTHNLTSISVRHNIGFSGKMIRTELPAPDGSMPSATAFAADVGYLGVIPETKTSFGFSAMNVGGKIKYISVSDPLPLTLRAGVAQKVGTQSFSAQISADMIRYVYEELSRARLGVELALHNFYLRGGYKFMQDTAETTFGGGVNFMNFSFDLGVETGNELGSSFQAGLSYRFGKDKPDTAKSAGRPRPPAYKTRAIITAEDVEKMNRAAKKAPAQAPSQDDMVMPLPDAPPGSAPAPGTMAAPERPAQKPAARQGKTAAPEKPAAPAVPDFIILD